MLHALSVSLWHQQRQPNSEHLSHSEKRKQVCTQLNAKFHTQAKRILDEDCISPHNNEDFDADKFISSLDEDLWDSICLLTQPTTDRSKNTQTRKIRRIFAVCILLFTINRQCSSPIHTLITDAVEPVEVQPACRSY